MIGRAVRIWREDGARALRGRAQRFALRSVGPRRPSSELPVAIDDVLAADWTGAPVARRLVRRDASEHLRINWVIPAIGVGAGGHNTILRFVRSLEERGHICTLFVYDPHGYQTEGEARDIARRGFPGMRATIHHGVERIGDCDALIATAWQTAYPVFNARSSAGRFYFVQDFEPYFHSVGTASVLAEATYRFGLHGITAGRWLAQKLSAEYGMACDSFEFGSDPGVYRLERTGGRATVVFYARPSTPRRGFELGIMALELLARTHPELTIHMLGADIPTRGLRFEAVNRGILRPSELNLLYNEAIAALVLSFTNMSLLPLELLSAGCIPVVNAGDNNRLVCDNPHIVYADPAPHALARALAGVAERPDAASVARAASQSVQALDWGQSAARVESILIEHLGGFAAASGAARSRAPAA